MPYEKDPTELHLPGTIEEVEPEELQEIERRSKKKLPRKEFENLSDQRDYLLWPDQEEK